jgi:hypothetical protein
MTRQPAFREIHNTPQFRCWPCRSRSRIGTCLDAVAAGLADAMGTVSWAPEGYRSLCPARQDWGRGEAKAPVGVVACV